MTPTVVRFPRETLEHIDDIAGEKQRARFVREAVEAEIEHWENGTRPSDK